MSNLRRLPGPVAETWDWQRLGACRGRDSAQFFHPDGERGSSRRRREAHARAVCAGCPVRAECAAHALAVREPYGVWGGFSESERLRLLAMGWEDLADLRHHRVDVARLEARLGLPPTRPASGAATPRQLTPSDRLPAPRQAPPGPLPAPRPVPGPGRPPAPRQVAAPGRPAAPRQLPGPRRLPAAARVPAPYEMSGQLTPR